MKLSEEAKEFLENNRIRKYSINSDGTIDVNENVKISTIQSKLPVKFGRVKGYFYCDDTQLTSLEGVPSYVNGFFSCEDNQFTSLHDVHKYIKVLNGHFYCCANPITDSILGLLMIEGVEGIYFDNTQVQDILNRHISQGRAGVIGAQQELLDANLDEYARL